ncbi:hypothetical protein ZWY2020_045242 [Hordeum vulgare]|nr:hypothetical protein ZWY2020_045242 [Hordeum vulgare]
MRRSGDGDGDSEESWRRHPGAETCSPHFLLAFDIQSFISSKPKMEFLAAPSYFTDGDGNLAGPNHAIMDGNEKTQGQSCSLLSSFLTEDSPLYMLNTSDGTMGGSHGVLLTIHENVGAGSFAFAGTNADMCFDNNQKFQFLGQPSTCSSPEIIDLTEMDETHVPMELTPIAELVDLTGIDLIDDVPMLLAPRKNITLALDLDGKPHVDALLAEAAHMFEIVVFTASISSYANQLINALDPKNRSYEKDRTIIETDLLKVVIIDNAPEVFQQHVNNVIP